MASSRPRVGRTNTNEFSIYLRPTSKNSLKAKPCLEKFAGGVHSDADILFAMRRRNEACLELRRREVGSALQQKMEELGEARRVAVFRGLPIGNRLARKKEGEHRAYPVDR